MARLEELTQGTSVKGVLPGCLVMVVDVRWHGSTAVELTYKDPSGNLGNQLLFRDNEPTLEIVEAGRPWSFDGDGALFRLVSEAHRIRLAHLFDPVLAVHTSLVDPLPIRLPQSMKRCCLASRFASYWRTTPVQGRRSWQVSSSRNSSCVEISSGVWSYVRAALRNNGRMN